MKNKNVRFFCSALAFLTLLILLLIPLSRLLARKSLALPWNTTTKISGFYNEEQDQFEVMFFGSSHAYAAFSPLELWEETGVKSYVFATQQQPLWATYTYIEEALKTQSPSLVVVECRMAFGDKEYYMEGNDKGVTFSYMDDIPLSWNKVKLAFQSAPDLEGRAALLFNFMMYHDRWNDLHRQDFTFRRDEARDPYKGYVMLSPQEEPRPRPDVEAVTDRTPLLAKNRYWLEEIVRLCKEEGVDLWLVKTPSNLELEEKALLNSVEDLAAEKGVPFHDFNEDYAAIGLSEDLFHDEHHLDCFGASRFTRFFARALTEGWPELRTDWKDPAWTADIAVYQEELESYSSGAEG